jgi:hypothetical protein
MRASMDSVRSGGADSNASTRSRRSSFALERASFDANRTSLEAFGHHRGSTASLASLELAQVRWLGDPPSTPCSPAHAHATSYVFNRCALLVLLGNQAPVAVVM